jgi:Ca2+-binding EF-hand superfamily protein
VPGECGWGWGVEELLTPLLKCSNYINFSGDGEKFSTHIMRIFDSDGNGFLDFKEFLLAIDIATCQTEESKLAWVFKLYDVDNDGIIDVREMAVIMETMECLESKHSSNTSHGKKI